MRTDDGNYWNVTIFDGENETDFIGWLYTDRDEAISDAMDHASPGNRLVAKEFNNDDKPTGRIHTVVAEGDGDGK